METVTTIYVGHVKYLNILIMMMDESRTFKQYSFICCPFLPAKKHIITI